MRELRRTLVKGLNEYTGCTVVDTDNPRQRPEYPFISFKITTLRQTSGEAGVHKKDFPKSLDIRFKHDYRDTVEFQPYMIISFQTYSDNLIEALEIANRAWEYIKHVGYLHFEDINVVMVDVGDIQDRTVFQIADYEYRGGFDVKLRYLQTIERRDATIETWKVTKGEDY